jgi:hypothetical protein
MSSKSSRRASVYAQRSRGVRRRSVGRNHEVRSKYMPHQGPREMARRAARLTAD